jgi:hypothetical protein
MSMHSDRPALTTAEAQHGALSSRQAREAGLTDRMVKQRLASGRWTALSYGVYRVGGAPDTWRQRLWVALLEAGDGAFVSHRSSSALFTVPGFAPGIVEVSKPKALDHTIRHGVLHESGLILPGHLTTIDGIPCSTLARSMFELAAVIRGDRLIRAVDNAMAHRGLTSQHLEDIVRDMAKRGRKGSAIMRKISEARGPHYVPPESGLESELIDLLVGAGLPEPERQLSLGDEDSFIGRVDLGYRRHKVLLEVDGAPWHASVSARAHDRERRNRLTALGFRILNFDEDDIRVHTTRTVRRVRTALAEAIAA